MNLAAEAFSQFKKFSVWLLMSKQKGMFLGKKVLLNPTMKSKGKFNSQVGNTYYTQAFDSIAESLANSNGVPKLMLV